MRDVACLCSRLSVGTRRRQRIANAADRSRQLREEGGRNGAQPDLSLRRQARALAADVPTRARRVASLRAGAVDDVDDAATSITAISRQAVTPARCGHSIRTSEPGRLVDTLLVGAVVEARSCERFEGLARARDGTPRRVLPCVLLERRRVTTRRISRSRTTLRSGRRRRCYRASTCSLSCDRDLVSTPDVQFRFHSGLPAETAAD